MHLLSNSRRLRVASFVAAGVIGFGGVAAAGPVAYDTVLGGDETKTEEPVEEPIAEPSDSVVETTLAPKTSVTETTAASSLPENEDLELEDLELDPIPAVADVELDEVTTTVALVDDPDTAFDETTCAEGNHGKTVSLTARETPSGPGKGQIVSEAAHSSCGKDDKPDDESDDDESDDDDKSDKQDKSGGHGNSAGGGKGNSSNDKGHGKHKDD